MFFVLLVCVMRVMYMLGYPGYPDLNTYISYLYLHIYIIFEENIHWLVLSTPLKNISQWEGLSHILWKIINVPNHQPVQAQGLPHYPLSPYGACRYPLPPAPHLVRLGQSDLNHRDISSVCDLQRSPHLEVPGRGVGWREHLQESHGFLPPKIGSNSGIQDDPKQGFAAWFAGPKTPKVPGFWTHKAIAHSADGGLF